MKARQLLKVLDMMHERRPVQSEASPWGVAAEVVRTLDAELGATRDLVHWLISEGLIDPVRRGDGRWAIPSYYARGGVVAVPAHLNGVVDAVMRGDS